nr:receptor-like protein EIX1 [Arachis hypogaea]
MRRKEYSCNATVAVVLVMLFITQIGGFYACIQQERQILLNFKRSLILSDDKEPLPSWEGDGDCCEWEGIACDNVTRHVVKIDLKNPCSVFFTVETSTEPQQPDNEFCLPADAFAEEDFSRHLSQLQHLTYLDLSGVAIQENPAFLGSMQRLRYLSLRVYYAPAASYTFPTGSIGNLTNLRALYLESLFFANVTDSSWLAPLSSLQYLGLKAVDLSMPQAHHLFKVLNTLPSLLHLHLPACSLGQVSSSLVSDPIFPLTNLTRLQLLNLAWNGLNQDSPVLHAFQNFTSIKVLDISRNFLSSVPSRLAKVHNLVKLDLSSNNITVLDPLKNLTSIRVLNLNENNLNSIVPFWLGKFKNLVRLDLSRNILYGPVPCALRNLTSLTFLNLSNNHLNSLPSCLAELKSLIHLAATVVALVIAVLVAERHGRRRKRHPIAGTVFHQLVNFNRLHDYMTDLARKHSSYRLLSLSSSEVCTSDPTNVEYILKTNFSNYGKGRHQYEILRDLLGDGIFTVDGEKWRHQRKTASYQLSSKLSRDYSSSVFKSNAVKLAAIVSEEATSNKAIEIQVGLFKCIHFYNIYLNNFGYYLSLLRIDVRKVLIGRTYFPKQPWTQYLIQYLV